MTDALSQPRIESASELVDDLLALFLAEVRRHPLLNRQDAAELEVSAVREARDVSRVVTSLDRPVGDDDATPFGALIASDEPGPDEQAETAVRREALRRALMRLPERERTVLKLRYGIGGDEATPLREAGRQLGISSEAVRQLERRALAELAESDELETLRPAA